MDASGLVTAVGPGNATITATETDSGVSGTATVSVAAAFGVTPDSVNFGKAGTTATLEITAGGQSVAWSLSEAVDWLEAIPDSGVGDGQVTLTANRGTLANGDYSGTLSVTADGQTITVPVSLGVGPILEVTPDALEFGGDTLTLPVTIHNAGSGYFNWSTVEPPDWFERDPTQGLADAVVWVTVDRTALATGQHEGTLQFLSNGGNASVAIRVTKP